MTTRRQTMIGSATVALGALWRGSAAHAITASTSAREDGPMNLEAEVRRLGTLVAELARRTDAAEGYIAISNLQRAYGYYVDKAQWDHVADLFAEDGAIEINGRGLYEGRERVRTYMHKFGPPRHGALMNHMQLQPVIHVAPDGMTAKARLRALIQVGQTDGDALWGDGVYENDYVKQGGVWKIKYLHFYQNFYVPYEDGWGKSALPLVSAYDDFPPDRPTEPYPVFPDYFLPPFHYKNPVSGRG
jgi:hypothetical protein